MNFAELGISRGLEQISSGKNRGLLENSTSSIRVFREVQRFIHDERGSSDIDSAIGYILTGIGLAAFVLLPLASCANYYYGVQERLREYSATRTTLITSTPVQTQVERLTTPIAVQTPEVIQ